MDRIMEALYNRRAIRKFKDKEIPEEILQSIAEAGTYAPSASNKQSAIIIIVNDEEKIRRISKLNAMIMNTDKDPFYGCKALMIVLGDRNRSMRHRDASLVMANLMYAAYSYGIGTTWVNRAQEVFDLPEGKEFLKEIGVEGDYEGVANCIMGYPDGEWPKAAPRKENYIYWAK